MASRFVPAPDATVKPLSTGVQPPHLVLTGQWIDTADLDLGGANILGDNGRYLLKDRENTLQIPIADSTPEHLAYYGTRLVKIGDAVQFDCDANLPLTVTCIGKNYAEDYLTRANYRGSTSLEVRDRPHFHMPLDENAAGYLILGKAEGKNTQAKKQVSVLKVPYGYGILMAPWTVHADSHLTGRYLVIYSVTENFSTVIIRRSDGGLAPIRVG